MLSISFHHKKICQFLLMEQTRLKTEKVLKAMQNMAKFTVGTYTTYPKDALEGRSRYTWAVTLALGQQKLRPNSEQSD